MTWAATVANGRGVVSYRLEIERLETQFVTHPSMATSTRKPWLKVSGKLRCLSNPITGELDVSGLQCSIVDVDYGATAIFAKAAPFTTWLTAEISPTATTMSVRSTTGWPSSGYLWIDSECIAYTGTTATTFTGLTRGSLSSLAQTHYIATGGAARFPEVTSSITSIAGCRARLYAYGENDDPQGDGTQIWLGVVTRHPTLQGPTWSIYIDPITSILTKTLSADLQDPTTARGIKYDWANRLNITFRRTDTDEVLSLVAPNTGTFATSGFFESNEEMCSSLNAVLAAQVTAAGWDTAFGCSIRLIASGDSTWYIGLTTDATVEVEAQSTQYVIDPLFSGQPTDIDGNIALPVSGVERYWLGQAGSPVGAGSVPRGFIGQSTVGVGGSVSLADLYPINELFIAGVEVGTSVDSVSIEWAELGAYPKSESTHSVASSDTATNSLLINEAFPPDASTAPVNAHAWTAPTAPKIRLGRTYTQSGNIYTALVRIIGLAPTLLNAGAVPDLRSGDLDGTTWNLIDGSEQPRIVRARAFTSFSDSELMEIVKNELLIAGFMMGTSSTGKIAIAPIRTTTPTEIAALTIDTVIGTPSWEPTAYGMVNQVSFERGYSALEDDYTVSRVLVRNVAEFGRNPRPRTASIEPKSIPAAGVETLDEVMECAQRIFAAYAGPYAILNVETPLTSFNAATIGAVVSLTSTRIPDYETGTMGVTNRRCIVTGREVDLGKGTIKLRLYTSTSPTIGYAPEALITAEVNASGDIWRVTLDSQYFPSGTTADDWFAVSDIVQARLWDSTSSTFVDGVVTVVSGNDVTVSFYAPVTLGTGEWFLTYMESANTLSASQYVYAFLGDADMIVNKDGAILEAARRFS